MSRKKPKKVNGTKGSAGRELSVIKRVTLQVKDFYIDRPGEAFGYMSLIKHLRLRDKKSKEAIKKALFALETNGYLKKQSDNKYLLEIEMDEIIGRVDHVNSRFAYIIIPDREDDVWVRSDDLNLAVDGDTVAIQITKESGRAEGRVIKIIERAREEYVGRIEISEKFAFVIPDNRNIHFDVFVYSEKTKGASHNDKVLVKIKRWHDKKNKSPLGEITQVLGSAGENEAEIHSIMAEFGLPFEFPKTVEKAADKIPTTFTKEEIKKRRDFRKIPTMTVDPADAKDFDDALSIQKMGEDKWEIGVHIADVSHYVEPGSILDNEAVERATSVYLVDRTIPMLPEVLSNGLCSLRPNEEKMTFSAVFELNTDGKVSSKWFGRTIIESDRRFAYEEAQERIESGEGDYASELQTMNAIALKLRAQRFKEGAVNFETTEVRFRLDEKGKPLEVVPKERKDAHKMIEEFMLLANKEVARFIFSMKVGKGEGAQKTFVYRTHDDPDPEKLETFSGFAKRFGHKISVTGNISNGLNKLMDTIQGKPEQNILEQLAIRSMSKAKYTTNPVGHFGLAFDHYTHFTSPIRRYPDVMVHRLLQLYLDDAKSQDEEAIEKLCEHSSSREKRAADTERASIKFKQVEFMSTMLGEEFNGVVSGVTEWGVFVEINATKCEGLVRIADLDDDYYEFDSKRLEIVGKRNKLVIALGDALKVKVVRTDIGRRTIDLLMVG